VTFWHVELDEHDVILAEGMEAESFLDCGDRSFERRFGGNVVPSARRRGMAWETDACAPLVVTGLKLAAARAKLRVAVLA
jgi:hypothetical protein